jgi:shikimate kinase
MSGTGKSTLVQALRQRGFVAYDADDDGFSEPRADGRWGWRREAVAGLLAAGGEDMLFFAGCSEEQAGLPFDYRILLTAPDAVLVARLRTRTNNPYARTGRELAQVLADRDEIEPLLRRAADLVLTTTAPPARLVDAILAGIAERTS